MNIVHIVEVVLLFSFMIFIHEGGHYLACRYFGVDVDEFALGFGPLLLSRKWGKTLYTVRAVPLGGFCKPKGGDLSGQSAEEMYAKAPEPGEFLFAAWWKRILVFLAGPGMNLVSALVIMTVLFYVKGEIIPVEKPVLGFVAPGSVADKAGLRRGDLVLRVNGKEVNNLESDDLYPDYGRSADLEVERAGKVLALRIERPAKPLGPWETGDLPHRVLAAMGFGPVVPETEFGITDNRPPVVGTALLGNPARNAGIMDGDEVLAVNGSKPGDWGELAYLIRNSQADPIRFDLKRGDKVFQVSVRRIYNGVNKAIGISPVESTVFDVRKLSGTESIAYSGRFCLNVSLAQLDGIWKICTGRIALMDNAAGPVTIMRLFHKASEKWEDLLHGVAVISLVLFLMNLLPIPVVDGGQIVLCLIEGIKRKPVSVKAQMVYQQVGFVLIVGLMGVAVFNDFKNIFLEIHNKIH